MRTIEEIIEVTGGWDALHKRPIKIEVENFMPLHVEIIGRGSSGGVVLSVMHTFLQNGDVMRDPDVVIEIVADSGDWMPISYRQDSLGIFQEPVWSEGGNVLFDHGLIADLRQFLNKWDANLKEQGFVAAAKLTASQSSSPNDNECMN